MTVRLHLRARHVGPALVALTAAVVVGRLSATWLAGYPAFGGARARVPVVVLVPLLAAVLVSSTLAGADADLEESVPRLTRRWRAGHAAVVGLAATVAVATCATAHPWTFGSAALARNALGLAGLVLLTTAVLPANLSWAPTLGYTLTVYLAAPHEATTAATWWAWTMQAGRPDGSWVVALALAALGAAAYAVRGSTPSAREP